MAVDPLFLPEGEDTPVTGGYAQPGPGITEQIVVLADTAGVALATAAGTASVAVLTVQGSASGTAIPVSGTVTAGGLAQGSTTSGQTGTLVQGAVTTSNPTYTTAQTDPLSLDTSGRLRTFNTQFRDSNVTVQSSATASAPTAGTAVATLTTPAAGTYEISGTVSISGTTVATAESNNFNLKKGGTTLLTNIPIAVNSTTGAPGAYPFGPVVITLDGSTSVTVNAVGNATGSSIYAAQLIGRQVG
jgi:hypothetical protein